MALFRVLLVALVHGETIDELCESCGADSAFLQLQVSQEKIAESKGCDESHHWHATKAVHENRLGQSSATGMFPLPPALDWEFTSPSDGGGPVIDDKLNVYIGSEEGKIFSFDQHGTKRWETNGTDEMCENPVLFSRTLYIGCRDGSVLAIDTITGNRLWQSKVSKAEPDDIWTIGVSQDYIFTPAGILPELLDAGPFHEKLHIGTPAVALLRRIDGQVLWKFDFGADDSQQELLPCMLSDSVIFTSQNGAVYRIGFEDGHVIWKTHVAPNWFTTAQLSCTDEHVLVGLGTGDTDGGVQALDIETGKRLWNMSLPYSVTTPLAVGHIHGHEGTAIIAAMGQPAKYPNITTLNHTLWAVDASTGKTIWTFDTASLTARGCKGSTLKHMCQPQSWSPPVISKDGTVYINWSYGGITYALRDSNKDGVCDPTDPEEVSSFDFGIGNYGGPALAPGMLAVRSCHGLHVLKVPEP